MQMKEKTDTWRETVLSFHGVWGHLVELAQPDAYSDAWKKWTYDSLPMIPEHWQHEVKKDTVAQYRVLKRADA